MNYSELFLLSFSLLTDEKTETQKERDLPEVVSREARIQN